MSTQTMGLFEAKTHLSELIARAERGDDIIITRHNRPVARIVPFVDTTHAPAARRAALRALLQSANGRKLGMDWRVLRDTGRR
ncbi:MAG: type II toxin-antitoxin system prevent-host-death family antitoxin [Burkholderiaceae bacterium]|nr:type II toxin-antitoxin system prevent-host-death family antitoxin [Burkholderiaceae bacterium]